MPVDVALIESEIEASFRDKLSGPRNERDRLDKAYNNLRFSQAEFDEFPTRYPNDNGFYDRTDLYRRTTPLFQRIMEVLTRNLYKSSPARRLRDAAATEWLAQVYKANAMWAKWQRADELTVVGDYAAFQFSGDEDQRAPVKIQLWGADSTVAWTDPDDATVVGACAIIDAYDGQKRLRLYTEGEGAEIVTYLTRSKGVHAGSGGQAWYEVGRELSPYTDADGVAFLPFSFVHFRFPSQDFYSGGIGNSLFELNDYMNFFLDTMGDAIRYETYPITVAEGVDEGWAPPAQVKPGLWLSLPGQGVDAAGNPMGPAPTLNSITRDRGFIPANWEDANNYLDHELEMHGIPPATIRMVQSSVTSGVALQVEQTPLLDWVDKRRGSFTTYEERAIVKAFQVGGAWLRANGMATEGAALDAFAVDPGLILRWPKLYTILPGPQRDAADDYRVSRGYATKVQVFMEREQCTEEEAFEHFEQVKKQNERLAALGIDPGIAQPEEPSGGAEEEEETNDNDNSGTQED